MPVEVPKAMEGAPIHEIAAIIDQISENADVIGVNEELSLIELEGKYGIGDFRVVLNDMGCVPICVIPISQNEFRIAFGTIDNITTDIENIHEEIEENYGIQMTS